MNILVKQMGEVWVAWESRTRISCVGTTEALARQGVEEMFHCNATIKNR